MLALIASAQCQQTAEEWFYKGVEHQDHGNYEEAIRCFDEVLRLDPDNAEIWNIKGVALRNLGRYDDAIKCYDEAVRLDPDYAFAW
ncbi:MAG: tetratricopeptide repeat protein, partial [Methanothrix sp.]|nr:tetratricopeptide repeat protein [Methanothrix sp.]